MLFLARVTRPFVVLLSVSTHGMMRILGFRDTGDASVTEEDIHAILREGSASGVIEQSEHAILRNVFRLDERPVSSMMVPRTDIVFLDTALSLEQNLQRIMESPHSRFPVCHRHMDELLGVVNAKQLFAQAISGQDIDIKALAQPCHFIPESFSGMALLEHFRATNSQMVFVVDEYGDLKGIVTLQDLLEALTGEFNPSSGNDLMVIQRDDGSLLLDGLLSAPELKDALGLADLPGEVTREYETLNGLFMYLLGRVPVTTDKVVLEPWTLEIVDMDGMRIDKVLAIRAPLSETDPDAEDETG
jgi:putative hemolysin